MLKISWSAVFLLATLWVCSPPFALAGTTTIAVTDFYNLSQNKKWHWLSKGLSDMLITDLSAVSQFQVVDREGFQEYLKEMELQSSGLFDESTLMKVGQFAKVEKVVFGTYFLTKENQITIQTVLVDIGSRKAEKIGQVEGKVGDVLNLEKTLAKELVDRFGVSLGDKEALDFRQKWTESVDAAAHFYTALEHYDNGLFPKALAEAKFAARVDPNYLPARFWINRLYVELAEFLHAEQAMQQFLKEALKKNYKTSYLVHSSMLLAQLYERYLEDPEKAVPVLERLKRENLDSLERANIHLKLGNLYRETRQYHKAYDLFVSLYKQTTDRHTLSCCRRNLRNEFKIPYRSVSLMPSIRQIHSMAIENYQAAFLLAFYNSDTAPAPQPEMMLLTPENPEFGKKEIFQGWLSFTDADPRPMFYAPRGQRFKSFTFEFRGKQKEISIRPLLHQNRRFDQIGQKEDIPDPKMGKSVYRYEAHQEMIQAFFFDASVRDQPEGKFFWKVKGEFMPVQAPRPGSVDYWHGLIKENIEFPRLFDTFGQIGGETTLHEDHEGKIWAIYDTDDLRERSKRDGDSDFWYVHSADKQNWQGPARMTSLNSTANDFSPTLIQDGRKRFVIVFVSDRRGENDLWLSLSKDGKRWQRPRRLLIKDSGGKELNKLVSPKLIQDSNGIYRLAAFHTEQQKVLLTTSRNLTNWEAPTLVALPNIKPSSGWKDEVALDYLEDNDGIFRLIVSANFRYDASIYLGSSKDGKTWNIKKAPFDADSQLTICLDDGKWNQSRGLQA
jgi:TolB-like protein